MWILIIFPLAFALLLNYFIANEMQHIAESKGYVDNKAFNLSFWLGAVGYFYTIALPDLVQRENEKKIIALLSNGYSTSNENTDVEVSKTNSPTINNACSNENNKLKSSKYVCKNIVVSLNETNGTCMICFSRQCKVRLSKIKTEIGTRELSLCGNCIQLFQENATDPS